MTMHSGEIARRALPRLLVLLFLLLVALLALFGARPGSTVYADLQCGDDIQLDDNAADLVDDACKEPKKSNDTKKRSTCDEGEHRVNGVCSPIIDCGKDPYKWNPMEQAYQRPFNKWCEPHLFDSNEGLYDGMTCGEVAAALGQNEQSFCDWSEVFG